MNTYCKKCYFAKEISSNESPCQLNIIDVIKDTRELSIVEDFYHIKNYACRYGLSKEIYNDKIKEMDIDIESYAVNRVTPKYLLYVIANNNDNSIQNICNQITKLTIKPEAISIVTQKDYSNSATALTVCHDVLHNSVDWKLHILLDNENEEKTAKNLLSTDKRCANCQFIFFIKEDLFNNVIANDSIKHIDFIINKLQPIDMSILCSKSDNSYFNGIFIRMDNFKNSTSLLQKNISTIILENYTNFVGFYD